MDKKIWYERDIEWTSLRKKSIAVIGYGAQGRSHALNLRDSGCSVTIGQRPGRGFDSAVQDGFSPISIEEATANSDVICLMLPDELHGPVFQSDIVPHLQPNSIIICCHGFSLLYEQIVPPPGVAAVLVAPKGAGHMVRTAYENGGGVACLVALGPHANESEHLQIALEYAKALGGGRAGILRTTIAEETETDLFGEQVVLCGGVSHLAAAAFETLVNAGYQPEVAYFECIHELKLVVDLLHKGGMAFMRDHISNTAEYGDYTRGPRIVDEHVRQTMQTILAEIRSGQFAREWIAESQSGGTNFESFRKTHRQQPAELAGQDVLKILNGE